MSGPVVKSHIWPKMGRTSSARLRTTFLWWSLDYHWIPARAPLRHRLRRIRHRSNEEAMGNCSEEAAGNSSLGIPEWLEDSTENLEIVDMPAPRKHFSWLRSGTSYKSGTKKAQYWKSLPEGPQLRGVQANQNYKGSLQKANWWFGTWSREIWWFDYSWSRSPQRRMWISEHRYSVVVQDFATRWIQSYPCKTKTSQETERSLRKFPEPTEKPKVIYTDNSLDFGKSCEDLSWNHRTSTPHRSETNGIAERAVRRIKEGTLLYYCHLAWMKNGGADSLECNCYPLGRCGRHFATDDSENHLKARWYRLVQWLNIRFLESTSHGSVNLVRKFHQIPRICIGCGNLERRCYGCRQWGAGTIGRVRNPRSKKE